MGRGSGGAGRATAKTSTTKKPFDTKASSGGGGANATPETFNELKAKDVDAWGGKHYDSYIKSLSKKEQDAITDYTGGGFEDINNYLRGQTTKISAAHKNAIKNATAALEKSTVPENITVHRGIRAFGPFKDLKKLKPGSTFEDKGFGSTSMDESKLFGSDVKIKIHVPKGTKGAYIAKLSQFRAEKEFLLPPGTKYRIKTVNAKKKTVIVEVIP